jgi:hypothetical protein
MEDELTRLRAIVEGTPGRQVDLIKEAVTSERRRCLDAIRSLVKVKDAAVRMSVRQENRREAEVARDALLWAIREIEG